MASLEQVAAQLASEPSWWWGYSADHGWIVLDREDVRNNDQSRHLIRCRDWNMFVVDKEAFGSAQFVWFKNYITTLPKPDADRVGDELLALYHEFASRAASMRVTAADLQRQRLEERLRIAQARELHARIEQEAQRQSLIDGGWMFCSNPQPMLDCLGQNVSVRKLRLFGIACCRRVWDLITYKDCQRAILLIERLVEGEADADEVQHIREEMGRKWQAARGGNGWKGKIRYGFLGMIQQLFEPSVETFLGYGMSRAKRNLLWEAPAWAWLWAHNRNSTFYSEELKAQAALLREILGNPFRPVTVDTSWLVWNDSTVVKLAQASYGEGRFKDLPVLADALEEAGCTDPDILNHCRHPGEHVRGCWVVDLLLNKS